MRFDNAHSDEPRGEFDNEGPRFKSRKQERRFKQADKERDDGRRQTKMIPYTKGQRQEYRKVG